MFAVYKLLIKMLVSQLKKSSAFANMVLGVCPSMNFATKIMGGNTNNKADSAGRRLGIKKWGHNAEIFEGDIIARQRGHKWQPGMHVHSGKDHTLHASLEVSGQ